MPALWHWKHLASNVSLPGASGNPGAFGLSCAHAARDRSNAPSRASTTLDGRYKVVFTDALQHQESRRTLSAIDDQVRAAGLDRVRVAGAEPDLLLGIAQEEPEVSLQHVERVLDIVVIVPGHLLDLRKLDLGDAETRPRGVLGAALDFVEMTAILDRFHGVLSLRSTFGSPMGIDSPAPSRGRRAELALESPVESGFGLVTAALGHARDGTFARAQRLRRERQAPAHQVLNGRLPDQHRKTLGQRGAGKRHLARQ